MSQPSVSAPTSRASSTSAAASPGKACRIRNPLTSPASALCGLASAGHPECRRVLAERVACSLDHDAVAAAPRIPGGCERAVLAELDPGRTSEVEVPAAPADELVTPGLEARELVGIVAPLAVDVGAVEVDAGPVDRLLDPQPVRDRVDDDLEDRSAEPQRAGASDHQSRPPVAEHERRRHPAREADARLGDPARR